MAGAVAFVGAVAASQGSLAPERAGVAVPQAVVVHAPTVNALRDRVEALRADLLAQPGVRMVTVGGLVQQGLAVEYSAGRLALRADSGVGGFQQVADMPVKAGGRVFRLGDVAAVVRVPMAEPVSTMTVEGEPAARVTVEGEPAARVTVMAGR